MTAWTGPRVVPDPSMESMAVPEDEVYASLVVDSGPIIRQTGMTSLRGRAKAYYTVPAVLQEIRDAKARHHLEQLPFVLQEKEPSAEAVHAIVEFSRQTGDYQSLSAVDIQVMALAWDLEREGCNGRMDHIRKSPKRTLGVGKIESLAKPQAKESDGSCAQLNRSEVAKDSAVETAERESTGASNQPQSATHLESDGVKPTDIASPPVPSAKSNCPPPTKSWAMLVNPNAASSMPAVNVEQADSPSVSLSNQALSVPFGKMGLSNPSADLAHGQFSDAEEDEPLEISLEDDTDEIEHELEMEFPSLAAAATVPYEGSDDESDGGASHPEPEATSATDADEIDPLKPVTKSGKLYNSFRKYGNLMKPSPPKKIAPKEPNRQEKVPEDFVVEPSTETEAYSQEIKSRIVGGLGLSGQEDDFEDDGEGWITSPSELASMKATGTLDPLRKPGDAPSQTIDADGPPRSMRAACTTTDFAMQNVLLQMNLELLSVDGVKIRRLKSWVIRCGACYRVHSNGSNEGPLGMKKMFCSHCGSDFMQRIAASVDGKTGRLRLHMKKNYQHNLRGTKFSLPKAGSGNRFQGDLLLREDQLLSGAWNQKVKVRSGGKSRAAAESIFGKDLASTVGCNKKSVSSDDIAVGFGRRNPNAAKGRERRGKKKKSSDRACGLRRY